MNNQLKKIGLASLMWVLCTVPMYAFPDPPDGSDDPLPEAPIDQGIWILVVFGILLSVFYFRNRLKMFQLNSK